MFSFEAAILIFIYFSFLCAYILVASCFSFLQGDRWKFQEVESFYFSQTVTDFSEIEKKKIKMYLLNMYVFVQI